MRYAISKIIQTCSVLCAHVVLLGCLSSSVAADPADVRVLVDVSGSMKQADPKSVRGPATALLAALLPANSLGGIWLFGSDVRELVPHGAVDARWTALGQPIEASIGSTDRFTHIESALRTGVDIETVSDAACHVILITDGIVDVQGGPEASRASRDRIIKSVVPNAVNRGCRIHTIALSGQADIPLLRQVAIQTDGLFTLLDRPGDLIPVMLDALELALRSQQLPVVDNRISVDPSIRQLRLIRLGDNPTIAMQGPDGLIAQSKSSSGQSWYRGQGYETLLWRQPTPGAYTFEDALGPNDRILIDSDIQLRLEESAPTIASDQTLGVAGQIIGPNGSVAASDREYRVAFGPHMDPLRVTGPTLQTQLDSPAPGRTILTVQSFDAQVQRQVQRAFEVLRATPEMDIANNTAQGVGSVGSPIQSSETARADANERSNDSEAASTSAHVEATLPEELKQWPLWQIIAVALAVIAALALLIGLVLRPKESNHRGSSDV
jgi:hypothetical protein